MLATDSQIKYNNKKYPFQEETYQLIGICMKVHRVLGKGLSEIVYKDALEYEFTSRNIKYKREREYQVEYKSINLLILSKRISFAMIK